MMQVNRFQQAVVLVEVVNVLSPKVRRREHQAVVFRKESVLVCSLDILNVQAQIAQGHIRLVVVDDFEQLEHLEERPAKGIGDGEILVPW